MTVLAIDTSESACSVALISDDRVIECKSEIIGRGHAERLLPLIEERLQHAGLTYADLKRIAVSTGPGTFTGLRIGLAVARGLALQGDLPCVGLTGLQVLAKSAREKVPDATVYPLIAGRGGQAFVQKFPGSEFPGSEFPGTANAVANLDLDDIAKLVQAEPGVVISTSGEIMDQFAQMGCETIAMKAIDVAALGLMARSLDPALYPPEPTYFRAADAVKAKPILPVAPL